MRCFHRQPAYIAAFLKIERAIFSTLGLSNLPLALKICVGNRVPASDEPQEARTTKCRSGLSRLPYQTAQQERSAVAPFSYRGRLGANLCCTLSSDVISCCECCPWQATEQKHDLGTIYIYIYVYIYIYTHPLERTTDR